MTTPPGSTTARLELSAGLTSHRSGAPAAALLCPLDWGEPAATLTRRHPGSPTAVLLHPLGPRLDPLGARTSRRANMRATRK